MTREVLEIYSELVNHTQAKNETQFLVRLIWSTAFNYFTCAALYQNALAVLKQKLHNPIFLKVFLRSYYFSAKVEYDMQKNKTD